MPIAPSAAADSTPRYALEARLLPDYSFLVPVRVNGAGPFWCSFDSGGSRVFALDSDIAARANLRATGAGYSAGVGPAVVTDGRLPDATLEIGPLSISNRTVVIRPLGPISCVFGIAILDAYVVELDFIAPSVRLYDAASFRQGPHAVSVPATMLENGSPVVTTHVLLQPGEAINAGLVVDTGASQWAVALQKRFTDDHNIPNRARRIVQPPFQAAGAGGSVGLLAARADSISVAEFSVPSPVLMLLRTDPGVPQQWDGVLGNEFLRRFLLTIDYPNRHLFLEPNRNYSVPPQPYDGSGIWVRGSPGKFAIENVLPEGPGALAGLEKGDILLSLDGTPATELTIVQIRQTLYHPSGKCAIRIRRGDREWSTVIELKSLLQ